MLYNILAEDVASKYRTVSLSEVSLYALLGFLVVFAGIILLIAIIWTVGKVMSVLDDKKGKTPKKAKKEKATAPTNTGTSAPKANVTAIDTDIDEETVAVIMATVIAYYQTNYPKCEFTVKRIKRI